LGRLISSLYRSWNRFLPVSIRAAAQKKSLNIPFRILGSVTPFQGVATFIIPLPPMFIHWVWEMRRTDLSARIANASWLDTDRQPEQPALCIEFDGTVDTLKDWFQGHDNRSYTPDDIDLFYRLQQSDHAAATGGVLGVTDTVTGTYVLEVNIAPDVIEKFVSAVREYAASADEETRYTVELWAGGQQVGAFDKETLLIYGTDGALLRHRSLIPDSIET
jgi:hypothetical protein